MLARHRVYGGVGGHGAAIVCWVVRRKGGMAGEYATAAAFTTALIAWVVVSCRLGSGDDAGLQSCARRASD